MKTKKPKGLAAVSLERRREIASMGGKALPKEKRGFSVSPEAAARAGRIGGLAVPPEKRGYSRDPLLAQEAGRKGGRAKKHRPSAADHTSNHQDALEPGGADVRGSTLAPPGSVPRSGEG
jgi:general stress protein YciG